MPRFEIVNVPPSMSSRVSFPSRARPTSSARARAISCTLLRSTLRMTGTTRPFGAATASPTCALGWRWISSPVKVALMARWRTSATPTNRVSRSFTVGFTSPSPRRSTICSRRCSASVMSIETPSWKTGAAHASVSRRAIVRRVPLIVTISTSASAAAPARRRTIAVFRRRGRSPRPRPRSARPGPCRPAPRGRHRARARSGERAGTP